MRPSVYMRSLSLKRSDCFYMQIVNLSYRINIVRVNAASMLMTGIESPQYYGQSLSLHSNQYNRGCILSLKETYHKFNLDSLTCIWLSQTQNRRCLDNVYGVSSAVANFVTSRRCTDMHRGNMDQPSETIADKTIVILVHIVTVPNFVPDD